MPAPGGRTPCTYKSPELYTERIPILHSDQERLKTQLTSIFSHKAERANLITRIKDKLSDGLLFSEKVVSNPKVYEYLREALERVRSA